MTRAGPGSGDRAAGVVAIVLAAGEGERIGQGPKAFLEIGGRTILEIAMQAAAACPEVSSLVVAVPEGFEARAAGMAPGPKEVRVIAGGRSRQESVLVALQEIPPTVEVVVCHDAARPFAAPELFSSVIAGLAEAEGAISALAPADTVKRVGDGFVESTVPRDGLRLAQTPQAFVARVLREVHLRAAAAGVRSTDDAELLEWAGHRVRVIAGEPVNFKITSPDDLARAELYVLYPGARATHE
ncbi:MAG: 2-C-methyl-D-erythritol 4-phosphate cytidylyltransferase [Actinomycetota bacterium]|nr:2-C-methyl-D-erythritol 4-phosphate cytidylyltransferase [Actinomycetota bacterium]